MEEMTGVNGRLHNLTLQLVSNSPAIEREWRKIFAGWLMPTETAVSLRFDVQAVADLPPLPESPPIFVDEQSHILAVYKPAAACVLLHFFDGALVEVSLSPDANRVSAFVTAGALRANGRFEDVVFTSLAPWLRQRGLFLAHAFAASKNGRAALFVGPSQSGKTTTGINLLLNGWDLLANDVVLLEPRADGVYAWPTPGTFGIRSKTFALLPALQKRLALEQVSSVEVTADRLVNGRWAAPSKVTTLFFPEIGEGETAVSPYNRAIALTQLMGESMDRWDADTLNSHINCLQQLCQQAQPYRLQLGQDMVEMVGVISKYL